MAENTVLFWALFFKFGWHFTQLKLDLIIGDLSLLKCMDTLIFVLDTSEKWESSAAPLRLGQRMTIFANFWRVGTSHVPRHIASGWIWKALKGLITPGVFSSLLRTFHFIHEGLSLDLFVLVCPLHGGSILARFSVFHLLYPSLTLECWILSMILWTSFMNTKDKNTYLVSQ